MATEREKEMEAELERTMYTNCQLLGLDPSVLGGGNSPRVGLFRHSNPKLGEQLLYFLLSALRGPVQSAKDFDRVWPIFDSAQSRDFRKIVQGIISELESQGALPRSNSRVSSLATCCGPRFVELLWQLSLHALREVHRRTFAADVASNPLPSSLTDVSYLHAAALLPVTKAKIALERRKFIENANTAVHRQASRSNLAQEMTSEYRGLCAEEAYLQQEFEKLQDLRNKAKLDELWDERVSGSSGQNSHMVSKATRLWESLLSRKSQHEVLSSGPIEDLIAHREHRYRISGSSLLAAMGASSRVQCSDVLSVHSGDLTSPADDRVCEQKDSTDFDWSIEANGQADDISGRVHPTVDVAEVLRRWTHALQRVHKQSLHLAKANDGEGPVLLQSSGTDSSGHAESLAATLAEHRQHLISIQGLMNQLKEAVPAMQKSISELTEEVNSISSSIPMNEFNIRTTLPYQAQSSGRTLEHSADEVLEVSSKLASVQLEKASTSPALKLPHLFSLTPNSSGKGVNLPKRHAAASQASQAESLNDGKPIDQPLRNDYMDNTDEGVCNVQSLRQSVREAALSRASNNAELAQENSTDNGSRHFFMPFSSGAASLKEEHAFPNRRKQRLVFPPNENYACRSTSNGPDESKLETVPEKLQESMDHKPRDSLKMFYDIDGTQDQALSPVLLMDSSFFNDTYEDLLAPLSETDAALMEK